MHAEEKRNNGEQQDLVSAVTLTKQSESDGHFIFTGPSLYFPTERIYGGQIEAQAIMAGADSTDDNRLPHSFHSYFANPGDIHENVRFDVDVLRDGRSFSARTITATQKSTIMRAVGSYQKAGQTGISFEDKQPEDVPSPDSLESSRDSMRPYVDQSNYAEYYTYHSAFDIRHVQPYVLVTPDKNANLNDSSLQYVWMRMTNIARPQEVPQAMHRALLAFGCDQIMMEPALRRAGLTYTTPGIRIATMDHSMWWYSDVDMSQWHLYVQQCPVAGHGRTLCQAKVYQNGHLCAAISQEALIRVPKEQMHQN